MKYFVNDKEYTRKEFREILVEAIMLDPECPFEAESTCSRYAGQTISCMKEEFGVSYHYSNSEFRIEK